MFAEIIKIPGWEWAIFAIMSLSLFSLGLAARWNAGLRQGQLMAHSMSLMVLAMIGGISAVVIARIIAG